VERTLPSAAFDFDLGFDFDFDFDLDFDLDFDCDFFGRTRTRGCPILARSVRKGGIPRTLRFGF
jgi:hypothetical protein